MSSSTNQNTNARSMNGIISLDDGAGTIIENGTITTSNLEVLDDVGVNNLNVVGEVTADIFSLSFPDSSSKYNIDDIMFIGKLYEDDNFPNNIYLSGRTVVDGTLKAPTITLGTSDLQGLLNLKAPLASPSFTGTPNFSGTTNVTGLTKTMVGLSNVDNTSDVNKPISTATQNALDLKAPKLSPTFTGTATFNGAVDINAGIFASNLNIDDSLIFGYLNTTYPSTPFYPNQISLGRFFINNVEGVANSTWNFNQMSFPDETLISIASISNLGSTFMTKVTTPAITLGTSDLQGLLNLKAPLISPQFTGTPSFTGTTNVTGLTKTMVGLSNVDNTSDATKFTSTQFTGTPSFTGTTNVTGLTKTMVGLSNVDNTSDATKFTNTPLTGTTTAQNIKFPVTNTYGLIWGENYSKIYDSGDLHIETDDNMWINAPAKVTVKTPSLIVTGKENLSTFIASSNEKTTTIASKGANDSNYLIVQTISVRPNHSGTITVYSPLSFFLSHEASPTGQGSDTLTRRLNSASCAILKNGVAFSNPTVNSTNGYAITKSYLIEKVTGATWEQFVTNLSINFTPTYNASTVDVYQIGISASVTQTNYSNIGILRTINLNTDVSTRTSIASVTFQSADGANYIAPQNTTDFNNANNLPALDGFCRTGGLISGEIYSSGLLTANAGVSTTTLVTSGIITANAGVGTTSLYATGSVTADGGIDTSTIDASTVTATGQITTSTLVQCDTLNVTTLGTMLSAQLGYGLAGFVMSGSTTIPIICSVTNLGDFAFNDADDKWFIMAGYQVIRYSNAGYTGTTTTYNNSTGLTVMYQASSPNDTTSSIRVYFKNGQVTITDIS